MKTRISIVLSCLILLLSVSCSKKVQGPEVIKIDLDDHNRPLLNIAIRDIIPLETSQNSLMGEISKVICFDHRIFLLNNNRFQQPALYVFDEKGKFVRKTIRGKGPGEVNEPFAFAINREDSLIFLHDQTSSSTRVYDPDLNYTRSVEHDYLFISDFYHIDGDTFLIYHHQLNPDYKAGKQYLTHTLYSGGFTKEKQLGILSYNRITMLNTVSIFNNEVLILDPWNYTIYQLINGENRIRYILDFGKYSFTKKESEELTSDEIKDNVEQGKRTDVGGIFKTDDFLIIMSVYKDNARTYFKSLKNKEIYCFNDCPFANLMEYCFFHGITDEGLFFGLVQPDKLMEFQKSTGKYPELKVTENDNPYVIFFKVSEPKN
ncbi:MAG: 6-bladed beta-propeller [Bacteroidia bacterium]|nr:6-bladed beta-propeller [Bacteroidia bacterium]